MIVISGHTSDTLVTLFYMFNNKGVSCDYRSCNELIHPRALYTLCMFTHTSKTYTGYRFYLLMLYRTRKKHQSLY